MNDSNSGAYFVDGGTLRPNTPSYVKRPADDELFKALLKGEYCYVLTPRQMGKSSLMIRTSQRLKEKNFRTAVVDIQGIGTEKVMEWYASLLSQIRRGLRLSVDVEEWMRRKSHVGFGQLLVDFIQDVVLTEIAEPVVIFLDEVDWMIKIKFRDDFFASVRSTYNARAQYPEFNRISFVLLGVASPADLIAEPTRTPFNIGHPIPLQEFSLEDTAPLLEGLESIYPGEGQRILERIFHWTNGHPYLTQKICKVMAEDKKSNWADEDVDSLVNELFLSEESRKEANLKFIQDRIFSSEQRGDLLRFYKRSLKSRIKDSGQSILQNQLMLSGLLTIDDGIVVVRNRIYRSVFNEQWIDQNMPRDWQKILNIMLGILLATIIVGFSVAAYLDSRTDSGIDESSALFLESNSPEKRITHLAGIFRSEGILRDLDPETKAYELYFNALPSKDEQLQMFQDLNPALLREDSQLQEDLVFVIRRIYYSLAWTDPANDNTELLIAMRDALVNVPSSLSSPLREEISEWVNARGMFLLANEHATDAESANDVDITAEYLRAAIEGYTPIIEKMGGFASLFPPNPAIYYERGLIFLKIGYENDTLEDFDTALSISRVSPATIQGSPAAETSTAKITETSTAAPNPTSETIPETEISAASPALLPTLAVRSTATPRPESANAGQSISTRQPTLPPQPTITLTPSSKTNKYNPSFAVGEGGVDYASLREKIDLVLAQNPQLGALLAISPADRYLNLKNAGLAKVYPTLTPTITPTFPAFGITSIPSGILSISEANSGDIELLSQRGRGAVSQTAYSPDGKLFAVGSTRGIFFYDSTSFKLAGFIETTSRVVGLAYSPDGKRLAASMSDNNIQIWDVGTGQLVGRTLAGHSGQIFSLAFSPDGQFLASGSEDSSIRYWQISNSTLARTLQGDTASPIRTIAFSPDGRALASGTDEGTIFLWDISDITQAKFQTLEGHGDGVTSLAYSPDGRLLASTSEGDGLLLWSTSDLLVVVQNPEAVGSVVFMNDGQFLAAISLDETMLILDSTVLEPTNEIGESAVSLSLSPDNETLLAVSADGTIRIWTAIDGILLGILEEHQSSPYIAISPTGTLLASGLFDGTIRLSSVETGEIIETLQGHTNVVRSLAFSPDGSLLASSADDGTVRLWSILDRKLIGIMDTGTSGTIWSVVFSKDSLLIAAGTDDGSINIWTVTGMSRLANFNYRTDAIYSVAFYPLVKSGFIPALAFGAGDGIVRVTDNNGTETHSQHDAAVLNVAYSPNGSLLATSSGDNRIFLWDVLYSADSNYVDLSEIDGPRSLVGHTDDVRSLAFSPDGTLLVSGSYDGTLRIWNVFDGQLLNTLTGHRDAIWSVAFSRDGTLIISGSIDGTIGLWGIP